MPFASTSKLFALTVVLALGFAAAGHAEDADGQKVEPPPTPDPGTTAQLNCIDQNTDYTTSGKKFFYVQTFENKCESRMRCAIFAYQLNARGPSHGHTVLILGKKSDGAAAKKSYALKIKGIGGFGTADRECRAI